MGHCTVLIGTASEYRECALACHGYICLQHRRFEGVLPFEPYQLAAGRPKRNSTGGKPVRPSQVADNTK